MANGIPIELAETHRSGHAEALAREAASRGATTVVAAGGDGTIAEVANGLLGSPRQACPGAERLCGADAAGTTGLSLQEDTYLSGRTGDPGIQRDRQQGVSLRRQLYAGPDSLSGRAWLLGRPVRSCGYPSPVAARCRIAAGSAASRTRRQTCSSTNGRFCRQRCDPVGWTPISIADASSAIPVVVG